MPAPRRGRTLSRLLLPAAALHENVAARIHAAEPEISARDLARKIAIATKSRCSESTAHAIKELLTMRANMAATLAPLTASDSLSDTDSEAEQA